MKNCIDINFKNISLGVNMRFANGSDNVYKSILTHVISKFEIDDISQFLSYAIDSASITDPALRSHMIRIMGKLTDIGSKYGFDPRTVMNGLAKASEEISEAMKAPLVAPVVAQSDEDKIDIEQITITEVQAIDDSIGIETNNEIPSYAGIVKMPVNEVRTIAGVYNHYLSGENGTASKLSAKSYVLNNVFKRLIQKNWLSTEVGTTTKTVTDNFSFQKVSENMKADAKETIDNYYKQIADGIGKASSGKNIITLLFFTDASRIPGGSESKMVSDGTIFYKSEFVDGIIIYSKNGISPDMDISAALQEYAPNIAQISDIEVSNINSMDPELKPKRITKEFAEENSENETILNAYASHIILKEFDTFVDYGVKELSEMYVEEFREGAAEVDIVGSNMATKFTKLGLLSTPKIHENSNNVQTLEKLKSIPTLMSSSGKTGIEHLNSLSLIKTIDGYNDTVFTYTLNGVLHTSIVVNVGITNVVFTNKLVTDSNGITRGKWFVNYPNAVSQREDFFNISSLDPESKLDKNLTAGIKSVLDLLYVTPVESLGTVANLKSVDFKPTYALSFIESINSKQNLNSNKDTFNVSTFKGNDNDSFIDPAHVKASAGKLSSIPFDFKKAGEFLFNLSKEPGAHGAIARALYYKYFHVGEYKITEVNPITNLLETTTHQSIYEKAIQTNDKAAWDSLVAIIVELHSTALDNKTFLNNGYLVKSAVENANSVDFLINSINTSGLEDTQNIHAIPEETIKPFFKVSLTESNGMSIKYYKFGHDTKFGNKTPELTAEFTVKGNTVSGDIPFTVVKEILEKLRMPRKVFDDNLYEAMKIAYEKSNDPKAEVNNFYGKLIALRLSNVVNSKNEYTFESNLQESSGQLFRYGFINNLGNAKDALSKALDLTFTRAYSSVFTGPTGTDFSTTIYSNLSKDKKDFISKLVTEFQTTGTLPELLKNNGFTSNDLWEIVGEFTRLGLKVGLDGKDTSELNKQELLSVMVNSFIQHTGSIKSGFTEGLSSEGTMSDRSKIDMFVIKLLNGKSTAPKLTEDGLVKLNEDELRTRFFDTQTASFSAMQDHIVKEWKSVFEQMSLGTISIKSGSPINMKDVSKVQTIRDIYNLLQKYQLDYSDVLHKTGLIDQFTVVGKPGGIASLNYSTVQLSEVVLGNDMAKKNFYLDMYHNEFMTYAANNNYVITKNEIKLLENRFDFLSKLKDKEKTEAATALALKIFFYNDSIFEQELIQFGMGSVFQYKTKVPSIMEAVNKKSKKAVTTATTLKRITEHDFGKGVTTKMTYDELKDLGVSGNTPSSIKRILESELSDENKLLLIEYIDTFAQISPQYVDRVKRNQASGTSGLSPFLVSDNEAGMFLGQYEKTLLIEDPTSEIFTLNSGIIKGLETYNGSQLITPEYAYKLNKSLGNRFSNFRSTSFYKTVNPAKTKDGVATYEKLAAFSAYTWEMMTLATPEHHSVHKMMMDKEKFSNPKYGTSYTGLYLIPQAYIKNPNSAKFDKTLQGATIQDQIAELKKHGEYLGKVQLTLTDGATNIVKDIDASVLLVQLERGTINEANIKSIMTNKAFVDSTRINSKFDLYNYYGGIKTNMEMLMLNDTEAKKNTFLSEFPFGWVELQVAEIMSNYRGTEKNYPIRNASINKINVVTTVKTGRSKVNPVSILKSNSIDHNDVQVSEVSNEFLSVILNAEHNYDVSSELSISASQDNNSIAMMTQIISNSSAEGNTALDVQKMNRALSKLTNFQLAQLQEEINSYSQLVESEDSTAEKQYAVNLVREKTRTMDAPQSTLTALGTTSKDAANLSLDLRMIQPLLRSAVNAEYNKRGIKQRFSGGQYVLAPVQDMIKRYDYLKSEGLMRSTVRGSIDVNGVTRYNSINGLLKDEITDEQFTGTLKDPNWNLTPITSLDQLIDEHSMMDFVYRVKDKVIIIDDKPIAKKVYEAIQVQDILTYNLKLDDLVSPWAGEPGNITFDNESGSKGKNLGWMDYYKNGVSFYESDEFQSFYLAGKAPVALKALDDAAIKETGAPATIASKLDFFKKEMKLGTIAVPKLIWIRFLLSSKSNLAGLNPDLVNAKIIGPQNIHLAYSVFESALVNIEGDEANVHLLNEFFAYVQSFAGNEQALTNVMKYQMSYMLNQDGWTTKEAEFFMPPQHQSAFLIRFGDALQDIVGTQEQPNLAKMSSIVGLTEAEIDVLSTNYVHVEDNSKISKIREKITSSGNPEALVYLETRKIQQDKMKTYFSARVAEIKKSIAAATPSEYKILKVRAPLFILEEAAKSLNTTEGKKNFNKLLKTLSNDKNVHGNVNLFGYILTLQDLAKDIDLNKSTIQTSISSKVIEFTDTWVTTLANNFEKSLTFLTARIPADAKHQTALGKIKGFVYSTKNVIYSPIELLALSGADFDIDKQNNLTWHVGSGGQIISWEDIISVNGELDLSLAKDKIDRGAEQYTLLLEKLVAPTGGAAYTTDQIVNKVIKYKRKANKQLKDAVQNFIVSKLMQISGSSKNAIESSTIVAMNKLGVIKDFLASFNFNEIDIKADSLETIEIVNPETGKPTKKIKISPAVLKLIEKRQLAIPYAPNTKMVYEKTNMDGKTGISVYASAIKTYMAIFNAAISNGTTQEFSTKLNTFLNTLQLAVDKNGNLTPIDSKQTHDVIIKTVKNKSDINYIEFSKINNQYIKTIWKDPETGLYIEGKELVYPANSNRFMPKTKGVDEYPLLHTEVAKKAYRDMMATATPEAEAAIVLAYKESLTSDEKFTTAPQAWQDFSELLNASTDNAKELILGAIGANTTTNSIIATMIVMGVDLKTTLLLINDPIIQNEVKALENDRSLVNNKKDFIKSFSTRLKDAAKSYKISILTEEQANQIREKLQKIYPEYTKDQIETELNIQKELEKKYNPAFQMSIFSDASTEFTNLSGILGINTGMENSEIDTFNYLMKVERALKVNGKENTLAIFFDEENPDKIKKMIENANKPKSESTKGGGKTAFNLPYIIYSNKVFYNYLKTLYKANELMKNLSYTTEIMDTLVKPLMKRASKMSLEKTDMYQFNDFLSNIAISTYYSRPDVNSIFESTALGKKYDLSKADDRLEFIKDMPRIKELMSSQNDALKNIKFLSDLQLNAPFINKETGKSLTLFGGINTKMIKDWDRASLSLDLKTINQVSPELHSALEHYSLIIDKGALGKSSIASLFGFDSIKKFNDHLVELKNTGAMKTIVSNIKESLLGVILPITLKKLSTLKGMNNREHLLLKDKESNRNAGTAEEHEVMNSDDETESASDGEQEYSVDWTEELGEEDYQTVGKENTSELRFDVTDVNAIKSNGGYIIGQSFVSQTNGLTYYWFSEKIHGSNKTLSSYIPVTRDIDPKVGNINIKYGESIKDSLVDIGFNYGWEIKLQNGETARLLGHESIDGKSSNRDYYYIKVDGKVMVYPGATIRTYNPQFKLEGKAITVKRGSFEPVKASIVYWSSEDGKNIMHNEISPNSDSFLYLGNHVTYRKGTDIVKGSLRVSESDIKLKKPTEGISFSSIKDKVYDEKILNVFAAIMANELVQRQVNKENSTYKPEIVGAKKMFDHSLALLTKTGAKLKEGTEKNFVELKNRLFSDPNRIELYEFMRKTDEERLYFINNEILSSDTPPLKTLYFEDSELRKIGGVNKAGDLFDGSTPILADYEFLTDKSLDNITIKQYTDILEKVGVSKDEYRKLKNIDLLVINTLVENKPDVGVEEIKTYNKVNEIFVTPNYKAKNKEVNKVMKSVTIDTSLSPFKEREKVKIASPKVVARLATFLNKRFKNTTVEVMNIDDVKVSYPDADIDSNDEAFVNVGQGRIALIKNRVTLDTFMHEMSHLYLAELKDKNLALYNNLMEKMVNDPIINKVKKAYSNENYYTNEDILEEAFVFKLQELYASDFTAQFLSEGGEQFDGLLSNADGALGSITNTFSSIFEDFFGGKFKNEKLEMTDSLADVMRKIGLDLIFKENSELHGMNRNDVANLMIILKGQNKTENQVIKELIDKGLMNKICK